MADQLHDSDFWKSSEAQYKPKLRYPLGNGQAAGDAALGLLLALDEGWDKHFAKLRGILSA